MVKMAMSRSAVKVSYLPNRRLDDVMKSVVGYEYDKRGSIWKFPIDYHTIKELSAGINDAVGWSNVDCDPKLIHWMREQGTQLKELVRIRDARDEHLEYEHAALLYPYQRVMVKYLVRARRALCADQMGLGKTPEAIAAVREIELTAPAPLAGRYLVICPNSLRGKWAREIRRWYGEDAEIRMVKTGKEMRDGDPAWYICNWEKTHRRPELMKVKWDVIVADESHRMKGKDTLQSKATRKLSAPYIYALTGTPIKNEVTDLWAQLNWLYPERYSSFWRFFEMYVDYHESFFGKEVVGVKNEDRLRRSLTNVMFGRDLDDIDDQLPPITPITIRVDLEGDQRKAYDQMREQFVAWIEGGDGEIVAPTWMTQILRLKQIAGSTAILDSQNPKSAKVDALMELIDETPADSKVVVMSQFRSMVTLVADRLRAQKIGFAEMMGGGHQRAYLPSVGYRDAPDRDDLTEWFQKSEHAKVFVGTIQAGGEGIDLFAANYFVFLDLMWTPADNEQALKRIHRRGQQKACFVYTILAKDTIDYSAILPTLRRKQEIVDAVMKPVDDETP